jgi:hypothetical protein
MSARLPAQAATAAATMDTGLAGPVVMTGAVHHWVKRAVVNVTGNPANVQVRER